MFHLTLARRVPRRVLIVDDNVDAANSLATLLRAMPELPDLRLVALTGYGQADDRDRAIAAGFDDHLVKPADLLALKRILAGAPEVA